MSDDRDLAGASRSSEVSEQELPGVGRRYELSGLDGMRLAVVIHHDGRRDVHLLTEEDDEPAAILAFTDLQARTLASVLEGAYARPTAGDTGHE